MADLEGKETQKQDGPADRLCCSRYGEYRPPVHLSCDGSCGAKEELEEEWEFYKQNMEDKYED